MRIFIQFFYYFAIFITFIPDLSSANECQAIVQKLYEKKTYFPTYNELVDNLGKPSETSTIRQIQYEWDDFFLITRDSKIVQKYGELPKKLKTDKYRYKNMDIRTILEALGEPETAKKSNLLELKWFCKETGSSIAVILTENNKIESYIGDFCRKIDSPLCTKYKREGLILLAE